MSQPGPPAGAAPSSAAAAVEPEDGEDAPVFDDDVALLEDDTPIQAEPDELEGTERDMLAVMMVATTDNLVINELPDTVVLALASTVTYRRNSFGPEDV